MSFHVAVVYPNGPEDTFDMDYYLATHMPLVSEGWKSLGLVKWDVIDYTAGSTGEKPQHRAAAHLVWKDEASWTAAGKAPVAAGIFGDIPNFTNTKPTITTGSLIASN